MNSNPFTVHLYHPSNSWIFMYGNDDPTERLRILDHWLSEFDAAQVESAIPPVGTHPKAKKHTQALRR